MSASSPPRRYLSIWLRRLATDRLARRSREPDETAPLVAVEPIKSALRISAMNDAASGLGIVPGMALADARAMYPSLRVAEGDAAADRRLLEAAAEWCGRYTPLVGMEAPDGIMLDVTGCAHLFGGEAALCRDLATRLARQGLRVRLAIADTVGGAWAVAHHAVPVTPGRRAAAGPPRPSLPGLTGQSMRPSDRERPCRMDPRGKPAGDDGWNDQDWFVVPPGHLRYILAPLPLAALRLAPEVVAALADSGLRRIADVLDLPRPPLAARFGDLLRRLDQALGREDEPITPRRPLPSCMVEQRFAEPIALERDVLGTIERLAGRLRRVLEPRQEGARVLEVALFRTDGRVFRIKVGAGVPVRDAQRVTRLFTDRLAAVGDACDPGFGYDLVRLSALAVERAEPMQPGLGAPAQAAELAHLLDRLGARFGLRRVTRLIPHDTHIPEFAVVAAPAQAGRSDASPCSPPPLRGRSERHPADSLAPARPVRLFAPPERIDAVAEVPDGPPVRFRWRRVLYEVAAAEGPERIAMEWWRSAGGEALTRDYFRVESRQGVRAWLYREGLYGRETNAPRWFMHGLFG